MQETEFNRLEAFQPQRSAVIVLSWDRPTNPRCEPFPKAKAYFHIQKDGLVIDDHSLFDILDSIPPRFARNAVMPSDMRNEGKWAKDLNQVKSVR